MTTALIGSALTLLLLGALLAALAAFLFHWSFTFLHTDAPPFVPTRGKSVRVIVDALAPNAGDTIIELGAGTGRIIFAAHAREPHAQYIAYEYDPLLVSFMRIKKLFRRNAGALSIRRANFFTADLSKATKLYGYLLPSTMRELEPKLERELAPGTPFYSCAFRFVQHEPLETIRLPGRKGGHGQHLLYEYRF